MANIVKILPSYSSALAECGNGYNDPEIAKLIAYRTAKWKDTLKQQEGYWGDQATNPILAVGIAGANLGTSSLRVLDFGGGCGFHYFSVRAMFRLPLKWVIVETQTMAELASEMSNGELEAHDNIADAVRALGGVDLVLTSGTVQYTPDPIATLDALIAIGAPYFMLARLPVWSWTEKVFAIQEGSLSEHMNGYAPMPPGMTDKVVKCPITFVYYGDAKSRFEKYYDCLLSMQSPSANYQVLNQNVIGGTQVFRRKEIC